VTELSPYPKASTPTQGQTTISPVGSRKRGGGGERSMVPPGEPRSYYGEPVVAKPVWTWEIATYLWVGGFTGASAPLALIASLRGNEALARRMQAVAFAGSLVSPVLLISDLGRPKRFLNMLRVFKITSPMSVGSWILSGFGAATALGTARELLGLFPRAGRAAQVADLALGPALSTYTAALIANTAIPVWHDARDHLPFVFATSSAATAGAWGIVLCGPEDAGPARRLAVAGSIAEIVTDQVMERQLGPIGEPYHEGHPGKLQRAAKALTGVGALVAATAGRRRRAAGVGGGLAILGGALCARWAIYRAGFASAKDPKYTVGPQRERLSHGAPASSG